MCDMLVEQSSTVTQLSPRGPHQQNHHHHHHSSSELSPQSSTSSSLTSNESPLHASSTDTPIKEDQVSPKDFSALQRLQYAFEENSLLTTFFNHGSNSSPLQEHQRRLFIGPNQNIVVAHHDNTERSPCEPNQFQRESSPSDGDEEEKESKHGASTSDQENNNDSNGEKSISVFQCPLCSVECNSRHEFNEHLVLHTQQIGCPKCTFLTTSEEEMFMHMQEAHDPDEPDDTNDDEGQPKINSQGKMKTFKCKQCEHVSVTKSEFWDHSKSHIRQEKMLTCPKCPFVTEYKHHLEYHLRNHFGSKPFQCNKCSYTCVNKSMLNSHLKSHSNVYQYRCNDCSYATKYCHSLKLHLRKYAHNPAMVLNPDGTPNPLPIIDVYGTRRGPKIKRPDPYNMDSGLNMATSPSSKPQQTKSTKSERRNKPEKELPSYVQNVKVQELSPTYRQQRELLYPNVLLTPPSCRKNEVPETEPELAKLTPAPPNGQSPPSPQMALLQKALLSNPSILSMASKNPMELYAAALNQYLMANPIMHMSPPIQNWTEIAKEQQSKLLSQLTATNLSPRSTKTTVDSGATTMENNKNKEAKPRNESPTVAQTDNNSAHAPLDLRHRKDEEETVNRGDDLKRRKRKGKALRYDRHMQYASNNSYGYSDDEESSGVLDFSSSTGRNGPYRDNNRSGNGCSSDDSKFRRVDNSMEESKTAKEFNEGINNNTNSNGSLMCKYCSISFPDPVLYTMHMKFHSGDGSPFVCKVCGKETADKVAFFLHLNTDSH